MFVTCDLTSEVYLERKVAKETAEVFLWEMKQKNSGAEKMKKQEQGRGVGSRTREERWAIRPPSLMESNKTFSTQYADGVWFCPLWLVSQKVRVKLKRSEDFHVACGFLEVGEIWAQTKNSSPPWESPGRRKHPHCPCSRGSHPQPKTEKDRREKEAASSLDEQQHSRSMFFSWLRFLTWTRSYRACKEVVCVCLVEGGKVEKVGTGLI